jgi:cytidine deaminase
MTHISNGKLIEKAASVVNSKRVGEYLIGNVGSALISAEGNIYLGVCIDASSGMGFCAEHSAIAAMITAGEYKIKKIVAVWKHNENVFILSPCGRCREFMRQIHPDNVSETEVILSIDKVVKLEELLPYHDWCHKTDFE